jgi:AcrR family transcriptional regulator
MAEHQKAPRSVNGRVRLLDTAEELLDLHGIDGVSLRTVTKAAGQRNSSAVNYHFGDRDSLIAAVLDRRREPLERMRHELLDALEARGPVQPREAIVAIVTPLCLLLDELVGRRYLRLLFQAANHPDFHGRSVEAYATSVARGVPMVMPFVEHLPADRRLHRLRLGLSFSLQAMAEQARLIDTDPPPRPVLSREVFTDDMVDAIIGALRG